MVAIEEGNCTDICKSKGLVCNIILNLNKTQIEEKAGISCGLPRTDIQHTYTKDYHPTVKQESGSLTYDCFGIENVNPITKCDATSPKGEKRICDCVSAGKFSLIICYSDKKLLLPM